MSSETNPEMENPAQPHNLVARLKLKEPAAFEDLVSLYAGRLYSVSFRILRNRQDAEDAVQETFLSVFQHLGEFREESSLYTWLYRVVCNHSLGKLRYHRSRPSVSIDAHLPEFERGQHTVEIRDWTRIPDLMVRAQELSDYYEQCIDELPEDHRIAYILKDVERLSEDRVCGILKITKAALKNRVHRARLVIRKRVEDRFFGSDGRKTGSAA